MSEVTAVESSVADNEKDFNSCKLKQNCLKYVFRYNKIGWE